jgi:hypothetical protein
LATKQEGTGIRCGQFSGWIRENMPDSFTGYRAYDIDFVLWRKTNWKVSHIMIVEQKNGNAEVSADQALLLSFLSTAIKEQCKREGIQYYGTHIVQLETGNPDTGKIELNGVEITKQELIKFLSME